LLFPRAQVQCRSEQARQMRRSAGGDGAQHSGSYVSTAPRPMTKQVAAWSDRQSYQA